LIRCIERRVINPHSFDGAYLNGKILQHFKGFEGDGTPKLKANIISQLCQKLRNYVFDGSVKGRQKQTAEGELFTLHSLFLLALPIPFSNLLLLPMFQSWVMAATTTTITTLTPM
jgi:hypothetical protein